MGECHPEKGRRKEGRWQQGAVVTNEAIVARQGATGRLENSVARAATVRVYTLGQHPARVPTFKKERR